MKEAYDEAYAAAYESLSGIFGLFEKAESPEATTMANLQAALDSQVQYFTKYQENLSALKAAADVNGIDLTAVWSALSDGSSEAAAAVAATYTDNEGDEADDLQIVLHDREGIWMQSWLSQAVAAAASQGGGSASQGGGSASQDGGSTAGAGAGHSVGEPVQLSGAGFHYTSLDKTPLVTKTGTFYFYDGLLINGKYRITSSPEHCGQQPVGQHVTGWVNAEDCTQSGGDAGAGQTPGGMVITAAIVRENWTGPGSVDMLDCGQFELDSVECSGPPDEITIKGTSLPFKAQIRQTKKTRAGRATPSPASPGR